VWGACCNEYSRAGADGFRSIGVAERDFTLEDVPCFVVGVVDVERSRATAAPFVDFK
jgi:hypothetical protein